MGARPGEATRLKSFGVQAIDSIDEDWIIGQPRFFSVTLWRAPKEEASPRWGNITEMAAVRAQLLEPSGEEEVVVDPWKLRDIREVERV